MKTLGIDFSSTDLQWIGIEGTPSQGKLLLQSKNTQQLPKSGDSDIENPLLLKEILVAKFQNEKFDRIGIVKAGKDCKPPRVKCELIIELACHEMKIPYQLVSRQKIRAAEKKAVKACKDGSFINAFNDGVEINPKYLVSAAICAWCVLQ
jgi:hypothetical protein